MSDRDWTRIGALGTLAGVVVAALGVLVTLYLSGTFDGLGPADSATLHPATVTSSPAEDAGATDEMQETADAAGSGAEDVAEPASAGGADAGAVEPAATGDGPPVLSTGDCLGDVGSVVVDCAGSHAGQVFATSGGCDAEALRAFLGAGSPDVLRPDLVLAPVAGGTACAVSVAGGTPLNGSVAGAFSAPGGAEAAQLRHCLDTDLRSVSCLGAHHGEVVGVAQGSERCPDVAARFLGWQAFRLPPSLALTARGGGDVECLLTVKGDNSLTSTLRGVGKKALPLEATS